MWDEDLLDDQKIGASYFGTHARLLAGPGTGKTLTLSRRAVFLITENNISPHQILALTFTRAAAYELRNRIINALANQQSEVPRVSTLHSFALRQLLRNSSIIETLPRPIRIADDWEERYIIFEDLKAILNTDLDTIKQKFQLLSSDWQTLVADQDNWEQRFPEPLFLGAWRQHRTVYGYTLRSELVYQLKRALEQTEEFSLESNYKHLLIDEYQDLNRCDLAVIAALRDREIEIYGAGDDDQSIYGFRFAHPEGIRRFTTDNIPSEPLELGTCVRCDRQIIRLSEFVADLDSNRLPKNLEPREDAEEGEVSLVRFREQDSEAQGVATICKYLIERKGFAPRDILILMRSDRNRVFSDLIKSALENNNIPVHTRTEGTPLDLENGRTFLAFLRILANVNDNLALRTLLKLRENQIGSECCTSLYQIACDNSESFSSSAQRIVNNPGLIPRLGRRIKSEIEAIQGILERHRDAFEEIIEMASQNDLLNVLRNLADEVIENDNTRGEVLEFLELVINEGDLNNHIDLLQSLSSSLGNVEQELDSASVNIMTMHKAKGLTAKAVILIAAEDEYIPGRQTGDQEGDARRLLYVSLSRAKHFLAITYCERRTGRQRYSGRTSGHSRRTLTNFLRDAPITPVSGQIYLEQLFN